MAELIDPTPELPDDTPIDRIRFPTRIQNVLAAEKLKTVGEVRGTSDQMLVSLPDLGWRSVAYLRKTLGKTLGKSLGMLSCDGVTPSDEKPSPASPLP